MTVNDNWRSIASISFPWQLIPGLAADLLLGRKRSLHADALESIARLKPGLRVLGEEFIPQAGPRLLTVNHYTRQGLPAWWLVLAVSACVPEDIHWIMTSAWIYPDQLRSLIVTPLTRILFRRVAQVYSFTGMPPMPPDPSEVAARARAVRQVLTYVRRAERPLIGLAPEGRDAAHEQPGVLIEPPSGVGRFALQVNRMGLPLAPVGVYEQDKHLCIKFGEVYDLEFQKEAREEARDQAAVEAIMTRIADLLPLNLRGQY